MFYILIGVIILGIAIFAITNNDTKEVSNDSSNDTAYYVEANGNFFVKIAKLCDDGCHYVINLVLDGVENIISAFL